MTLPSSNSLPAHRATSHLNRLYPNRQTSATTSSASVVSWKDTAKQTVYCHHQRCKTPIAQRYANVDELKADFMAHRNRHLSGIKRIGIAALVCIILLGFISYPLLHQQERALASSLNISKPRRIQSSASKPRILPHFPMAGNPCSQQLPSHLLHPIYKAPNSYPRERRLSTRCGRNPA